MENMVDEKRPVMNWPMSSASFYNEWHRLCELADIAPRRGSGVSRFLIKHFRKTASTNLDTHWPGMGEHIVGHASDRSGQKSSVSAKHYVNNEEAAYKCMMTLPFPDCFETLLPPPWSESDRAAAA